MRRGNSQCHYRYFPGAIYLHDGIYVRVDEWDSDEVPFINKEAVLAEINQRATNFRDYDVIPDTTQSIDIQQLRRIRSTIFPRTFYCTTCYKIITANTPDLLIGALREAESNCRRSGHAFTPKQFRYVSIDSCGFIGEGFDRDDVACTMHPTAPIEFRTNNSERISNFRWKCSIPGCGTEYGVFGRGHDCDYSIDIIRQRARDGQNPRGTNIEMVTKNIVAIPEVFHRVNLQDERRYDIKAIPDWKRKVFVGVTGGMQLVTPNLVRDVRNVQTGTSSLLAEIEVIERTNPTMAKRLREMIAQESPDQLGADEEISDITAEGMLDFLLAINQPPSDMARSIRDQMPSMIPSIEGLGLKDIVLLEELNLTTVLYGYSRGEYSPNDRRLCFYQYSLGTRSRRRGIRVYCSPVGTEGLMLVFDPSIIYRFVKDRVGTYIEDANDPNDKDECSKIIARTYNPVEREPIFGFRQSDTPSAWIYRPIHSMTHLFMRALGRTSGVDESSIAEMLFPSCCAALIFVNQSGEFNLGTFATCVDNFLDQIISIVAERAEDCIYDPICTQDSGGSCPSCLQIGEMSCENFNRDLSRTYINGDRNTRGLWQYGNP